MNKIKFLSGQEENIFLENSIYVTFSKTTYLKNNHFDNMVYFFDIPHKINEREINESIEQNLFLEVKNNSNEFYPLSFKYIYKYFLTYTQFYNRLEYLILKYNEISHIEYSNNVSFIFTKAISAICKRYKKIDQPLNEPFTGFSYRHNDEMLSDVPSKLDSHNIFILFYAGILRLINHRIFLLPSSFILNIPKSTNILKSSIFGVTAKFRYMLGLSKSSKYPYGLTRLDFSKHNLHIHKLDEKIWNNFRKDEKSLIEQLINTFLAQYPPNYLDKLKLKIRKLLRWSNTKCVIIDDTYDANRRLISSACESEKIEIEYLPHGIISEQLQFSYTKSNEYNALYIPKTLAWNNYSSQFLEKMELKSLPISFPLNISPHNKDKSKDILVFLSYGNRINLNQFEEDIIAILNLVNYKKKDIDWKIHHNIFSDSNNIMDIQKKNIEKHFNITLNFIDHTVRSSSIMKNYDLLIFTTYTTGIYEAAILNVPFIIYSNEDEQCHGINIESIPIAKNEKDFRHLLSQDNNNYLMEIRKSLTENIPLSKYLINKYS